MSFVDARYGLFLQGVLFKIFGKRNFIFTYFLVFELHAIFFAIGSRCLIGYMEIVMDFLYMCRSYYYSVNCISVCKGSQKLKGEKREGYI